MQVAIFKNDLSVCNRPEKMTLIDDQSRGNNKQSGYVQIHERAEKIVEGIVDELCSVFGSIKAVSLQPGRSVAK